MANRKLLTLESLNTHEFLSIVLVGTYLAFLLGIMVVSYYFLRPFEKPIPVINIDELEAGTPVLRGVNDELSVYIVLFDGEVRALDASAPVSNCMFRWVASNRRFEDPCSGAKWCIDGTIADLRHRGTWTLRSFETQVNTNGQILVNPLKPLDGEPLPLDAWVSDPTALRDAIVECGQP